MLNKPPTPLETLDAAAAIAREEGLRYVYVGNVRSADGGTTFCPQCRRAVIRRQVFTVLQNDLKDGRCPSCGAAIPGVWRPAQPAAAAPAK
jgi:pyruvate formate lyase activating enzyme